MIKFDGIPGLDYDFDSEIQQKRKKHNFSELLLSETARNTWRLGIRGVSDCVEQRVAELRVKYRAELERVLLRVYRPGAKRAYVPEMKRDFIFSSDGRPLASVWVEWPDPGAYLVVIRSEIYVPVTLDNGAHGCEGSA